MITQRSKIIVLGIIAISFVILLSVFVPGIFSKIDNNFLTAEYKLRGESKIDSSIVILYLDSDDITALGGLPLKRNYYALIVNALNELGAKAIGIDIAFTEPDIYGSEYDKLFASAIQRSGKVVLGGYFRSINNDSLVESSREDNLPNRFTISTSGPYKPRFGTQLTLPIDPLLESAAGFGHTNLSDNLDIPLIIGMATNRYVLAFPYVVLLTASAGDNIHFPTENKFNYPTTIDGDVSINYKGGLNSISLIRVIDFLKSYDVWRANKTLSPTIKKIDGKIILLGVIAEGRSKFIETPFSSQFPSLGIHAFFIDNVIHGDFLKHTSIFLQYAISIIVGLICILLSLMKREFWGLLIIVGMLLAFLFLSFFLFTHYSYLLSAGMPVFTLILVTVALTIYRHITIKSDLGLLSKEKENISRLLNEKESKLKTLEQELAIVERQNKENQREALLNEIQKYKDEVIRLQGLASDLIPSVTSEIRGTGERKEFSGIIYSPNGPMEKVISFIQKTADSNATVLILGESGTGKELVARALHEHSSRKNKSFIAVNCGALAETLLESELFGHEKGAFTGAAKERSGRFEIADGGTIFLDEIGETSEAFQVKLLRVLQDGTFERVGGTQTIKVDVRVIAATNIDIQKAVAEKKFREDLYYRLNVLSIKLPNLNDRPDDIPLLIEHFISLEDPTIKCSTSLMELLCRHIWKGNIRELESVIKRALLMAKAEDRYIIRLKDVHEDIINNQAQNTSIEEQIIRLLREKKFSHNSISETADDLGGLNRGTVSEYFRGYCFKTFCELKFNTESTVKTIAQTTESAIHRRVERKLLEYLTNAVEFVDFKQTLDEIRLLSKPKYKNLPQKYQPYLDEIITSAYQQKWSL